MAEAQLHQNKTCSKCGETKPLAEFNRNAASPDGHRPNCRSCDRIRSQAYIKANKEKHRDSGRRYYENNKEHVLEKNKKWKKKNLEAARRIQRESKRRWLETPQGKVSRSAKDALRRTLLKGSKAGQRTFDLLGYTREQLISHLEKQFSPGMSWENYGSNGWHIDHIVPLSAFNYTDPSHIDFKRAWALSNLRPLWAAENLRKHAKLDRPFQPSLQI